MLAMDKEDGSFGKGGDNPVDRERYPSADLIRHTIRVWEPRLGRQLSEEEARQILANVVGFFRVLHSWDQEPSRDIDLEDKK